MTTETLLTPEKWLRETGIRIMDDDGWRKGAPGGEKSFTEPITRAEFIDRCMVSTCSRWPDPPFDEREEPNDWFVSRLADALKSEFGAQFGMGINAPDEEWNRVARGIARKMRCGENDESGGTMIVAFDPKEGV